MESSLRFKNYIKKFGFKIQKVAFRPDILSVQYMNKHLMTIPKRMYDRTNPKYTDITGIQHPDYFECEQKANSWNTKLKRTDYLQEDWDLEREQDHAK